MKLKIMFIMTLMLCGRAMTLAFISRAGGSNPGDPPAAWLMPLIGDAVVGITGLVVLYLILKQTGLWVWTTIIAWNVVAIWDALSAFTINLTNPWPEFFMLEMMGSLMFFVASFMHIVIIFLASQKEVRQYYLK